MLFTAPTKRLESVSSVFKDMFAVPHPDGVVEGQVEEKPIKQSILRDCQLCSIPAYE